MEWDFCLKFKMGYLEFFDNFTDDYWVVDLKVAKKRLLFIAFLSDDAL